MEPFGLVLDPYRINESFFGTQAHSWLNIPGSLFTGNNNCFPGFKCTRLLFPTEPIRQNKRSCITSCCFFNCSEWGLSKLIDNKLVWSYSYCWPALQCFYASRGQIWFLGSRQSLLLYQFSLFIETLLILFASLFLGLINKHTLHQIRVV